MSTAPQTLPANFTGWDAPAATAKPPATLPANFSGWDAEKPAQAAPPQDSAASRFGSNLASGAGVMSSEDTKNFFLHPIDTLKNAFAAQGQLGEQAKQDFQNKDYVRGITHAAEYMMPFIGPNLAQAGKQLEQGDIAGGVGRTVGAALPMVAGSPEARAFPGKAIATAQDAMPYAAPIAKAGTQVLDIATFNRLSKIYKAWNDMRSEMGDISDAKNPGTYPGAPFPEAPPPELLQAMTLARGARAVPPSPADALASVAPHPQPAPIYPGAPLPQAPSPELMNARALTVGGRPAPPPQSAGLGQIPVRTAPAPAPEPIPPTPEDMPASHPQGGGLPVTLNGESALRQVLTGQDNANLLKIAKSRGINVTKEAALKPGTADNLLVNKIVNDFSPEELDEIRAQFVENTRFRHTFGDIGPEAWKTLSLKTYFPDLKIAQTTLARASKAISGTTPAAPAASGEDLSPLWQEALARVKAAKARTGQ